MRKLKYIKLFEAFDSNKLSKTLKYAKDGKQKFLDEVKSILDKIDFPESKISDDYFEYLPFNAALKKSDMITDEPCSATSQSEFPDYAVEGESCEDGKIKRMWGKRTRVVECPRCSGTGVEPKKSGDVKLVKFWFSKDGEYITSTAVDGIVRKEVSGGFDDDINKYEVGKTIKKSKLIDLPTGTIVLLEIEGQNIVSYIYNDKWGGTYALQNKRDGSGYGRGIARYSWSLGSSDHGDAKELILKEGVDYEPNPYTWNSPISFGYSSISIGSGSIEDSIKNAHFALVLDFSKLKKSEFEKKSDIKAKRSEIKKGAFLTDKEVRETNIKRYIDKISKSNDIISDISNVNKVVNRMLKFKLSLFTIIGNGDLRYNLSYLLEYYYDLINSGADEKDYYIGKIHSIIEEINKDLSNNTISDNIKKTYDKLNADDDKLRLELMDKLIDFSEYIYEKISSTKVETIEDLEAINFKIKSIVYIMESSRHAISRTKNLIASFSNRRSYVSTPYDRITDQYRLSDKDIKKIISEFDRLKNIISKI